MDGLHKSELLLFSFHFSLFTIPYFISIERILTSHNVIIISGLQLIFKSYLNLF